MPKLWLVPLTTASPVTIGADRIALQATPEWETFRQALQAVHPRLLPLFKAHLLPAADDEGLVCGMEGEAESFALDSAGDIVFTGAEEGAASLRLSHCAEAFLERLLPPEEALRLVEEASVTLRFDELGQSPLPLIWKAKLTAWWRQGQSAVVLAER
jgi:hypothetical protein